MNDSSIQQDKNNNEDTMSHFFKCAGWLIPLLFSVVGCASSYHCYPCGSVSCDYCPPKPLPYSIYESCNCTDSIGQAYLSELATNVEEEVLPTPPGYSVLLDESPVPGRWTKSENGK